MKLPININDLLSARTVEWERLEFKTGWNPKAIMHTMCAFANDFHNLGGGYIIIGVKENNGRPVLPPAGLPIAQIDAIQKEIIELGYRIVPYYHPIMAPYEIGGKHILVLWATGGQTRPYKSPVSMEKGEREFAYYIRKGSVTIRAGYHTDSDRTFFLIEFPVHPVFAETVAPEVTTEVTMEVNRILKVMTGDHSRKELQEMLGLKNAEHFRKMYLLPAIKAGLVGMTVPDKPKSSVQRYHLTKNEHVLQKLFKRNVRSKK